MGGDWHPHGLPAGRGDAWGQWCLSLSPLQRWSWGGSAAAGTPPQAPRHRPRTDPKARGKPPRSGMGHEWRSTHRSTLRAPVQRHGVGWNGVGCWGRPQGAAGCCAS